jgi:hypothetical protein
LVRNMWQFAFRGNLIKLHILFNECLNVSIDVF